MIDCCRWCGRELADVIRLEFGTGPVCFGNETRRHNARSTRPKS